MVSERMSRSEATSPADHAPRHVSLFNPLTRFLLRSGVPLGFNGLLTIRGRTSGQPRETPIAIIEHDGRRWVWSPWGDTNWVRNLRAAGRATVTVRKAAAEMTATELGATERVAFFRDVLAPVARTIPFGFAFIRIVDGVDLNDPVRAAEGRRVFELRPAA